MPVPSRCFLQHPGPGEELLDRLVQGLIVRLGRFRGGDKDQVPPNLKGCNPEALPEPPAHLVPDHRLPHLPAYYQPGAAHLQTIGQGPEHQQGMAEGLAPAEDTGILTSLPEPLQDLTLSAASGPSTDGGPGPRAHPWYSSGPGSRGPATGGA